MLGSNDWFCGGDCPYGTRRVWWLDCCKASKVTIESGSEPHVVKTTPTQIKYALY